MAEDYPDLKKWLRLHLTNQVGPKTFTRLLERLGGIDNVLGASAGQLATVPYVSLKKAEQIAAARDSVNVDAELALADKLGVKTITLESPEYPITLRQTSDPPPVLYIQGEFTRADNLAIAMVGSRSCSVYGREQSSRFAYLLAKAGFTIVSGLARGIDTAAHVGALTAQGRTIAVQARGLADVFPPENLNLAQDIAQSGAVISEFPLKYEPLHKTFPMRNRIIAGLSLATLVVEAAANSGSLHTVRYALENNREVMAVPGRVDAPGSAGCHRLIKDGAKLIENIEDIMEALGYIGRDLHSHVQQTTDHAIKNVDKQHMLFDDPLPQLPENEAKIIACLDHQPVHMDEIVSQTGSSVAAVYSAVTSLQLKGLIHQLPGSYFQKRSCAN
ncbi:MAG: DNA-processing protein DprA [Sedimentisphaerales bacterium]|nr:DNA-processing protein DprA [Sedimentisphaerales bacterium]